MTGKATRFILVAMITVVTFGCKHIEPQDASFKTIPEMSSISIPVSVSCNAISSAVMQNVPSPMSQGTIVEDIPVLWIEVIPCLMCGGKKQIEKWLDRCALCKGDGKINCDVCSGRGTVEIVCALCLGTGGIEKRIFGKKIKIRCPSCNGDGRWQRDCTLCSNGKITCPHSVFEKILEHLPCPECEARGVIKKARTLVNPNTPIHHWASLNSLNISMNGDELTVTAEVDFKVKAEVSIEVLGISPGSLEALSCGWEDGSEKPRVKLILKGNVAIQDDAKLTFIKKGWSIEWVRPCELVALNLADTQLTLEDIIGLPFIEDWVEKKISKALDKGLPHELQFRNQAEKGWDLIQGPFPLSNNVWLSPYPQALSLGQLCGTGERIETTITILAKPVVTVGKKPQTSKIPLPTIQTGGGDGVLRIATVGEVSLDEAENLLNTALKKEPFEGLSIRNAKLYGRENKITLQLDVRKPFKGKLSLEGTPAYELGTGYMRLQNLDYTLETKNLLAKTADWLLHSQFTSYLQKKAEWPVKGEVDKAVAALKDFQVPIKDQGLLMGNISSVDILAVEVTRSTIYVYVIAKGKAQLAIN